MRVQWLAKALAILCLCVAAIPTLTDEGRGEDPAAKAKEESYQPPKPGPEHALLAKDVGKWKAVQKVMMDPTKPAEVSEGTQECTLICNGLFLRSDYKVKGTQGDFHGSSVLGYDAQKKKYTGVWVDNMDTKLNPYEGVYEGGKFNFTMNGIGPDGKPYTAKMIEERPNDNTRNFSMMMPGPDGKMFTCMEITYTRM
jgi:hypothetical protein